MPYETFLRTQMDSLTFGLFFGTLILLGLLELGFELGQRAPNRRHRWPVNWGLTVLNILLLGAIPVTALMVADYARGADIGLLHQLSLPVPLIFAIGFLARSLGSWAVHLAMHKVPLFWRIHRVHHTDTEMDISTTVRFHPLEFALQIPVTYGLILTLGIDPVTIILYELADAVMAAFSHANLRLPRRLERALSLVLVTPHMHRVHHSSWQPETDSNYGATLAVWDRLFGTFRAKEPDALSGMELGLGECQDRRTNSPTWLLALPFGGKRIARNPEPGE